MADNVEFVTGEYKVKVYPQNGAALIAMRKIKIIESAADDKIVCEEVHTDKIVEMLKNIGKWEEYARLKKDLRA